MSQTILLQRMAWHMACIEMSVKSKLTVTDPDRVIESVCQCQSCETIMRADGPIPQLNRQYFCAITFLVALVCIMQSASLVLQPIHRATKDGVAHGMHRDVSIVR